MEKQINMSMRNYNNDEQSYRNLIQNFPNVIFDGLFSFQNIYELYKVEEFADKRISSKGFIMNKKINICK